MGLSLQGCLTILNVAYLTPLQRRYAYRTGAMSTVYRDDVTLRHGWKLHIHSLFLCWDICDECVRMFLFIVLCLFLSSHWLPEI